MSLYPEDKDGSYKFVLSWLPPISLGNAQLHEISYTLRLCDVVCQTHANITSLSQTILLFTMATYSYAIYAVDGKGNIGDLAVGNITSE